MKTNFNPLVPIIFGFLFTFSSLSYSQVPDDINGRLWGLAKVWGFAKYYHPNTCNVQWNNLLIKAIDSVLVSPSNDSYNSAISDMLLAAGAVPHPPYPLFINSDLNLNAHFDWTDDPLFSQDVRDQLDSIRINYRPKANCLISINNYADPDYYSFIDFRKDSIHLPSFSYSNESHRLLVLFYYWNVINYFHADKALMDQPWDSTLYHYIPLIREAQNDTAFQIRFLNLTTHLNDSHGYTNSPLIRNYLGTGYPLIELKYIENQSVITRVDASIHDISVGDIVKKIDGKDVTDFRDSISQYKSASNAGSLERDLHLNLLRGSPNSEFQLELEDSTGALYTLSLIRDNTSESYFEWIADDTGPSWTITECGYGYVNMGRLTTSLISLMYNALKNTPAIIFDIRNYPNGTLWYLIPYFYTSPKTWALLPEPDLTYPGWYNWYDNKFDAGNFSTPNAYQGKVIILVNSETQSQAEYTVMGLQQHPKAYTIGSQSAGADGNISHLTLPGALTTYWTSLGIFYPDSTNAQRAGVKIDSYVTPTIQGIRRGEDEVLASAFECLTSVQNQSYELSGFTLYPNPAYDLIYVSFDQGIRKSTQLQVYNFLGQLILQRDLHVNNVNEAGIDASQWNDGIYVFTICDEKGFSASEKVMIQH